MVVSTYQAASGAGAAAMEELELQTREVCFSDYFGFAVIFMNLFLDMMLAIPLTSGSSWKATYL